MNAAKPPIASLAALSIAALLCCAGCGAPSGTDAPDLAWDPDAPSVQVGAGGGENPGAAALDDATIDALVDEVSSPASPSDGPQDAAGLIDAHGDAYDRLLENGDGTLRHVVSLFLAGDQAGVRAEVMLSLMKDLLGEERALVEAEIVDPSILQQGDAQAQFGAWFAAAGVLLDRHGLDFMRENMPHTYAMLTAVQG